MSGLGSFLSLAFYVAAIFFPPAAGWLMLAAAAVSFADAREDMRRAKNQARDAYNASLADRLEMVDVSADQARTIVLGRVRCVEGVRRRWVSGANNQKLTMVVSFAGHEIDGFEQFFFDDVALTLDGSGYVTTAPYAKSRDEAASYTGTLDGSGGGSFTLPYTPVAGSVSAVTPVGSGEYYYELPCTVVSVVGNVVTLSGGPAANAVNIVYARTIVTPTARIRPYLGTTTQNIGSALASEYPGKITSTDKFAGIACAVVDIDYDPDVYPQGRPNVTALLRGAKVYDPRKDSTQSGGSGAHRAADATTWEFSENPALHALHYARAASAKCSHASAWLGLSAGTARRRSTAERNCFSCTSTAAMRTSACSCSAPAVSPATRS